MSRSGSGEAPSRPSLHLPEYAELHCLTNFTFLRGASRPDELVGQAIRHGYRALAITDECSFAGVVRAFSALNDHDEPLRKAHDEAVREARRCGDDAAARQVAPDLSRYSGKQQDQARQRRACVERLRHARATASVNMVAIVASVIKVRRPTRERVIAQEQSIARARRHCCSGSSATSSCSLVVTSWIR